MAPDRTVTTELRRITYVLFGLQLTVVGTASTDLYPLIVLGVAISLVAIIHPQSSGATGNESP